MNVHDVMENMKQKMNEMVRNKEPLPPDPQEEAMRLHYQEMIKSAAWKDFMKIVEEVRESPFKVLDEKSLKDITLADAGFIKGVRSAIKTIFSRVELKAYGIK